MFGSNIKTWLLTAICAAPLSSAALSSNYYHSNSILSSGHWVKIRVSESGMQQITYDQLRQWGFNDPEKVTIHGYGGVVGFNDVINSSIPDDLVAQPVVRTDGRILFYGESNHRVTFGFITSKLSTQPLPLIQRNNMADAGYYFITDSQPADIETATPIPYAPAGTSAAAYDYHLSIGYIEEEFDNPFQVGQLYFGPNFGPENSATFNFPLPGRVTTTRYGDDITIFPTLICGTRYSGFSLNVNGEKVSTISMQSSLTDVGNVHFFHNYPSKNIDSYTTAYRHTATVAPSSDKLSITITGNATYDYAALDKMTFWYPRANRIDGAQILITTNSISKGDIENISDANDSMIVWDVAEPYNVVPYETSFDAETSTLSFTPSKTYSTTTATGCGFRAIAFDPEASEGFFSVEYAGEVANQNIHAQSSPEFIILTTDLCAHQAERLADIHRSRLGQDVLVLRQEDIFNEFSSGTPSAWGIRRAVKMFYDRGYNTAYENGSKTRSLLIFGGGMYDNRCFSSHAQAFAKQGALTLTYGTSDYQVMCYTTKSYVSDAYFGMVDDCPAPPTIMQTPQQVNVGRIAAYQESQAITAVDKVERYLSSLPELDTYHRALILSDSGNENTHMSNSEKVASILSSYTDCFTNIKAYDALYEPKSDTSSPLLNNMVENALKSGVGLFTYSGHGNPIYFSRHNIWNINLVRTVDYGHYPLAVLATCDTYRFDNATTDITSEMLFKGRGGMIGVIAHCRTAYQTANQTFLERIAHAYAQASATTLTGDIYRLARNELLGMSVSEQTLNNTMCYNHAGDPALPLFAPSNSIAVSSINGMAVNADRTVSVAPLAENTIEGFIGTTDNPAAVDESFNGAITLSIFETPHVQPIFIHDVAENAKPDVPADITLDQDILTETSAKVVNGRFSFKFSTPLQNRFGERNRLTLFAYSDDSKRKSYYSTSNVVVDPSLTADSPADPNPPVISHFYINSPEFKSGDTVSGEIMFHAEIEPDESGINKQSSGLGSRAKIIIDDCRTLSLQSSDFFTGPDLSTSITASLNAINDGRHTAKLLISDAVGNTASKTIEFVIINTPAAATINIAECPARAEATINLTHDFHADPTGRLVIEDADGNTVFTATDCSYPFQWDLRDNDNNIVADGVYSVYAILQSGLQYAATPRAEIIVVK